MTTATAIVLFLIAAALLLEAVTALLYVKKPRPAQGVFATVIHVVFLLIVVWIAVESGIRAL